MTYPDRSQFDKHLDVYKSLRNKLAFAFLLAAVVSCSQNRETSQLIAPIISTNQNASALPGMGTVVFTEQTRLDSSGNKIKIPELKANLPETAASDSVQTAERNDNFYPNNNCANGDSRCLELRAIDNRRAEAN